MLKDIGNLALDGEDAGLAELRSCLQEMMGGREHPGRLLHQERLKPGVHRLRFELDDGVRSLVVKRSSPDVAERNRLVAERWLPAVGLADHGPPLLALAADRSGRCVWQVYRDLGGHTLNARQPVRSHVEATVDVLARLHTGFVGHALLPACRLRGGDLGMCFDAASVRDALTVLSYRDVVPLARSPEPAGIRDRLLRRMHRLSGEEGRRARIASEFGGPETLLHGDLWTTNAVVIATPDGSRVRLVDWDHAGVGPVGYDLSTFLLRFQRRQRTWIADCYRRFVAQRAGWRLPPAELLNVIFETAELARLSNVTIWAAQAALQGHADWAFSELQCIEHWFEACQPVLPATDT